MPFVPNNSNKICLDKKDILLEEYKRKINGNKDLSDWYKWLTYRENFSIIDLEKSYSNLDELLVNIAKASFDKELVVESRSHYSKFKEFIKVNSINIFDKDLAVMKINIGMIAIDRLKTTSSLDIKTPEDVYKIVKRINNLFKRLIEKNGGYKLLYKDGGRVKEKVLQALYFFVAISFCEANDVKIAPECDSGVGPVDFNFSKGFIANVNVEIKFADNPNLKTGLSHQLKAYNEAENTDKSIYLIVKTNESDDDKVSALIETSKVKIIRDSSYPEIFDIDGKMNVSASKRK